MNPEGAYAAVLSNGFQFNIVVSTNTIAVKLWKKYGFKIIGTTPKGFRHKNIGFVDTYIMFKDLQTDLIQDRALCLSIQTIRDSGVHIQNDEYSVKMFYLSPVLVKPEQAIDPTPLVGLG